MKPPRLFVFVLLTATCAPALAYVGPGAGLTLLGALWGLLAAVGAALIFVIVWPLRQWRKRVNAERRGIEADDVSVPDHKGEAQASRKSSPMRGDQTHVG